MTDNNYVGASEVQRFKKCAFCGLLFTKKSNQKKIEWEKQKCCSNKCRAHFRTKHKDTINHKNSKEYQAWANAKGRCFNENNPKYRLYGERGIAFYDKWINDYSAFLNYMGRCPEGHSLDRIDTNGNYEPGNCRWATFRQQALNRRPRNHPYVQLNSKNSGE